MPLYEAVRVTGERTLLQYRANEKTCSETSACAFVWPALQTMGRSEFLMFTSGPGVLVEWRGLPGPEGFLASVIPRALKFGFRESSGLSKPLHFAETSGTVVGISDFEFFLQSENHAVPKKTLAWTSTCPLEAANLYHRKYL